MSHSNLIAPRLSLELKPISSLVLKAQGTQIWGFFLFSQR